MIEILSNSLVPVFVVLLFGYAAGHWKVVDNQNVQGLVSFLMSFALPCSLFVTIAHTSEALLWSQIKTAVVLAIVYLAVFIGTYYALRKLAQDTPANSAVLALTLGFPNVAGIGIPLLLAVYGPQASVTVAVAVAVGAITVTPITLAILEAGTSAGQALSPAARVRRSALRAVEKPVFWAPVLAVLVASLGLHLPRYVDSSLTILGAATEGTALFATGLIASSQHFTLSSNAIWAVAAKNALQPALCFGVALLLRMPLEPTKHVVLLTAIPSGFFGILFGKGFGATPELSSSSLVASTVFGIVTLAGWIVLLSHLH